MIGDASQPADRTTRLLLLVVAAVCLAALIVPQLRTPVMLVAVWTAPLLVLRGRHRHHRGAWPWTVVAAMLTAWAGGFTAGEVLGRHHPLVLVCMGTGQVLGVVVVAHMAQLAARHRGRAGASSPGAALDVVVVVAVLVTVAAQLATLGTMTPYFVLVAGVDIVLLGALVKFVVSSTGLAPASHLLLAGGLLSLTYDLSTAVENSRLAEAGSAQGLLGTLAVLAPACAATHPSMRAVFDPATFTRRRSASTALLGLLPLVLAPAALAWITTAHHGGGGGATRGLPPWVIPVTGALVAGLCLVRAARVLRATEHLAERDPLTDLANRRGLARAHQQRSTPVGLLLLDVDEFKQVNDTHGHDVGDLLLLAVRDRLLAATAGDGVPARLGGDEFVVLTAPAHLDAVADRLLHALRAPLVVGALQIRVGVSIGLATTGTTGALPATADLAELLTHADIAMYAAKTAGGGRAATFHPDMRAEVSARYALSNDVRQLLAQDPDVGHLEVHFQPVVDLLSGDAVSAEALIRWRHPVLGLLAPDAFLGLVGSNDLDTQLDTAVLRATVHHLRRWQDEGRPVLPVSVNMTGASLDDPALATSVLAVLADAGVPTSSVRLEITEQDEVAGAGPAATSLRALRDAGILVLLDDYGTGYTSLDYLRRFPIQVLKLDRSLVSASPRPDADATGTPPQGDVLERSEIVAAVTAMAGHLGLQVIAEGVETTAERDELLALGIRYAQGYLFSRPVPAADFAARYLTHRDGSTTRPPAAAEVSSTAG
ncbi:putative bifunctional diguanylate cyclase/phosphodiesterase [Kineococcus sp. GCM10028916]|uniref:putative bifunctional diguanylate cyclase/phosphodiesterase n=1 Tax=Kineococcus sp. GCM10028916 TaxID=3273394 RepID=UPI00364086ED